MSQDRDDKPARPRILVALDASPASTAACRAAAAVAARLGAELEGLFIEDENLLRSAALPATRLVGIHSAELMSFSSEDLASQLQAQAERARRALEDIALAAQVAYSFRVARGLVGQILAEASTRADLVSLGSRGWGMPGERRLGSVIGSLLSTGHGRVLITNEQTPVQSGPIRLIVDDVAHIPALVDALADTLPAPSGGAGVGARGPGVEVIISVTHADVAGAIEQAARARLDARGLAVAGVRRVGGQDGELLHSLSRGAGLLVVAADSALVAREDDLITLLAAPACPVLLVR
ncbi:universal stress protein [Haliangium sp.]|uniref:universal stress protein n=1 Tax=Haliangium sp. TaxID=2663208 RepID=UPI003D133892